MPMTYVPVIKTGPGVDVGFRSVTLTGATNLDTVFSTYVAGQSFPRTTLNAGGGYAFGGGTAAVDTNLYRNGPGVLRTDSNMEVGGTLHVSGSLGVGNSVAATTPGAVVRKVEIFDAAGVSLGFLPVYNSIT